MSHHKFSNLRELLQGDPSKKVNQGVRSLDFMDRSCSCQHKKDRLCACKGNCQKQIIICKAMCLMTGKHCIGNTQQTFKDRMKGHFCGVQQLVSKGSESDSCASHFGPLFDSKPSPTNLRCMQKFEVIWQGNPTSVVQKFGTCTCQLCLQEKMETVEASNKHPEKLINSCSEICRGCRHKLKFHRCKEEAETPSTDELSESETLNVAGGSPLTFGHTLACPVCSLTTGKSLGLPHQHMQSFSAPFAALLVCGIFVCTMSCSSSCVHKTNKEKTSRPVCTLAQQWPSSAVPSHLSSCPTQVIWLPQTAPTSPVSSRSFIQPSPCSKALASSEA